jgi:hypothetical protein
MARAGIDIGGLSKGLGERVGFILNPGKTMTEVVALMADTRDVLSKLAGLVDKLDTTLRQVESRTGGVEQVIERLDRLEVAALNIERATLGVEAVMSSLPKVLRTRIAKVRRPGSGDQPEEADIES